MMLTLSENLLAAAYFMPHGTCYLWKPGLVGLHLVSNAVIALSYFSIPFTLVYIVNRRRDLPFNWIFFLFAAFIISCGIGHGMDIWTLWHPDYWVSGYIRAMTALVSFITAVALVYLMPKIFTLPSRAQMEETNRRLVEEINERKEVEQALRDSERRFRAIFNQTFQFMGLLQPDGILLEANQTALDFRGLRAREVINRPFWETYWWTEEAIVGDFSPQQQQLRGAIARAAQGEFVRYEVEVHGAGNTAATIDFSLKPFFSDEGEVVLVISEGRDITERKKAEEALRQSEERWQLALQGTGDGIFDWNLVADEAFMSARLKENLGYKDEEIANNYEVWCELVHPDDLEVVQQKIQAHLEGKTPQYSCEYRMHCKDASYKWILARGMAQWDEAGRPIRMVGSHQDISTRKQAEAEIGRLNQELEERVIQRTAQLEVANRLKDDLLIRERQARSAIEIYEDLVNNIPIGLSIWHLEEVDNTDKFQLVEINPAAAQLLKLDRQHDRGKTMSECLPSVLAPAHQTVVEAYAEVVRTGQVKNFSEARFSDSHLREQIFAVTAFPLPEQCLGIAFENITERQEAEAALQARAEELAQLNRALLQTTAQLKKRNQELDQFAYVTSHDLKAPLRAIANLSEWLEEDLEDKLDEDTRAQMNLLRRRVHRMENLINGLLHYSRAGRLTAKPENVDVSQLLSEVIEFLSPPSEFTIELEGKMPTLVSERLPLQQVLTNLIGNAIKHHYREDGKVTISVQDQGEYYQFAISDDGPGIAPEYHEKVFVIFQTLEARDKTENTGIGLSIVKKSVEAQGGTIELESQVGQGTTFRFTWPKSASDE